MKRALILSLCILSGLPGPAQADLEPGTYAPDIEAKDWMNTDGEPISIAQCRGMVVVLFFWVPWSRGGEAVMPLMTLVNASRFGRSAGVYIVGLTDAGRERVVGVLEKEKIFFPVGFEARQTFDDYDIDISAYPRVVIIDAAGKIAWTGWPGENAGQTLVEQIGKVVGETPPTKTHPEEAARVHAYLAEAGAALQEDRYRDAHRAAEDAFDHALLGDPLKSRCQDFLDLIEMLGRDMLARAERSLDEKQFKEAVSLLVDLRREFKGVEVARAARQQLKNARKNFPEVDSILQEQENLGRAETVLAEAMGLIRAREFGPAYESLEDLVNDYPDTETAEKADTILTRIRQNEGIMGYVRDHLAERACLTLLSQAEAYERTGRTNRARELYREVLDRYPNTIYAEQAIQRLAQLY